MVVGAGCSSNEDEEAIRRAYDGYLDALADQDGDRAAGLLSEDVHEFYAELHDLASAGGPTEINRQPIFSKLTITLVRVVVPPEQVQAMDGRDLTSLVIDKGWTDASAAADQEIQEVVVHDRFDLAEAKFENGLIFDFRREEGEWRLDFTSLLPRISGLLMSEARKANVSPNRYVFMAAEAFSGSRVTRRIWNPPKIKT